MGQWAEDLKIDRPDRWRGGEEDVTDFGRPLPPYYDAYLAHASEDKPFVRALAEALGRRGRRVWLDEIELVIGRSLRSQLDVGLRNSQFGIVILSPAFFAKRWPREELDALYSLESDGTTRILPVWHYVQESEVIGFSAMLASRFAAIDRGDAEALAAQLATSMDAITAESRTFWSDIVRENTRAGLLWAQTPQFFPESLRLLDRYYPAFWTGREAKALGIPGEVEVPALSKLFDYAPTYDGRLVCIIGHQVAQQLLVTREGGPDLPAGLKLHEYVVQIKTGDPAYSAHLIYARLAELTKAEPAIPEPPPDHLVLLVGTVIARGAMTVSDGRLFSGLYVVAARLTYVPKSPTEDEG